jgi:uncharacterized protein YjbJ (UPF0337 family)
MKLEQFESRWDEIKGKAKEKWGKLTNDDLMAIQGKKDQLLAKLRQRYNYSADEATREYGIFMEDCGCSSMGSNKNNKVSCA